ncbi:FAD-dependent monooxygenase [Caenimonas aquaedulcis]|uniref:FAD-dependent monooxygenase n=1 Tax=Caenimonas aquaedulcis TaxID=2793270 RepID=A0A931H3E4_9BURK|nr:FAD-dependent monooxygenase [Caenimonas aquaedulcis]MBG9387824.1 FAD-dependent monooxygenase [Caenimonas aquaedulcis]
MTQQALIVGGGIAGLAAATAAMRAGWQARLYERAAQFSEAGAGIQLGPNATRILIGWGLREPLETIAALPERLRVQGGLDGRELGVLELGQPFARRYGAPYLTVHRADLQGMLLEAARALGVDLRLASPMQEAAEEGEAVLLRTPAGVPIEGDALIGADGLWSAVRARVCSDGAPRDTRHVAYRALTAQRDLPARLRSFDVRVWLAPRLHVVAYPVSGGEHLNVVVLVEDESHGGDVRDWDRHATFNALQAAAGPLCADLQELLISMPGWRLWALHDRPPVRGPEEMARGRIALMGDAAHPMLPYFAQGSGMAIEDARELGRAFESVRQGVVDVPLALRRYALNRWQRVARVQAMSRRNGTIFHAQGPLRWARDLSLRLLSDRLLDQPWLYQDPWG